MGAGAFGRHMIRRVHSSYGCAAVAVASRSKERAEAIAEWTEIRDLSALTYEELLESGDVEAVYLAVPNHVHVAWTERLLRAGKHVLCEKPMCSRRADAERLFGLAAERGLVLAEGLMYMHHPQTAQLASIARRGLTESGDPKIGRLVAIRAHREWRQEDPHILRTRLSRAMHGGALMDLGCYPLSWPMFVTGRQLEDVVLVNRGFAEPLPGETEDVDGWCAWAGRVSGTDVRVEGSCSIVTRGAMTASLIGSRGTVWTKWAWSPDEGDGLIHFDPSGSGEDEPGTIEVVGKTDRAQAQFAAFASAVRGRKPSVPSAGLSIRQAALIEQLHGEMGIRLEPGSID